MLAKWKIELVSFLSSLTLISVGFSTWNISSSVPVIETIDGSVQTDYVIKTNDYVYFADDGITLPSYVEDGFITKNSSDIYELSNIGYLSLVFTVDYNKCLGLNGENSALKANKDNLLNIECDITLKNNANTFFAENPITLDTFKSDLESNFVYKEIQDETNKTVGYTLIISDYPYENLTQDGQIIVKLILTSSKQANIYTRLNGNTFIFDTKVHGHRKSN